MLKKLLKILGIALGILLFAGLAVALYNRWMQENLSTVLQSDTSKENKNRLLSTEALPTPVGAQIAILSTPDGVQLRTASWKPADSIQSKGTVLFCNGYSEFIEKYYEVVQDLLDRGYAVVCHDWRGQGLSSKLLSDTQKGYIHSFDDFLSDADLVYQSCVKDLPKPHILLAHSMGGHISTRILEQFPDRFDHAVLSAPMLGWPGYHHDEVVQIGTVVSGFGYDQDYGMGRTPPDIAGPSNPLSTDPERLKNWWEYYHKEPRLLMGGPTWGWMYQAGISMQHLFDPANVKQIQTPTLIFSAGDDDLLDNQAQHTLAKMSDKVSLITLPSAKHEILQETDAIRDKFWEGFDDWVK